MTSTAPTGEWAEAWILAHTALCGGACDQTALSAFWPCAVALWRLGASPAAAAAVTAHGQELLLTNPIRSCHDQRSTVH